MGWGKWGSYTVRSSPQASSLVDLLTLSSSMTNTRITDPEVLERRYPVLLHEFSLRANSGGQGLYRGGDGVIRDIEFLIPIQASILSERRVNRPYGLAGGEDAQRGLNLWIKKTRKEDRDWKSDTDRDRVISLGGKATVKMGAGDRIQIFTPGGGGWGVKGGVRAGENEQTKEVFAARGSLEERNALQLAA